MGDLFLEPAFVESGVDLPKVEPEVEGDISEILADFEFAALKSGGFLARCLAASCLKPPADPREMCPPPRQPFIKRETPEEVRDWALKHARRSHRGGVR